jgi:hypothetical protein
MLGYYSTVKAMHSFLQRMYWATLWAIFSKAHLVTLFDTDNQACQGTTLLDPGKKGGVHFRGFGGRRN